MNPKIKAADKATDEVLMAVAEARDELRYFTGRILNGWGIFADRQSAWHHAFIAYEALHRATRLLATTPWPNDHDYDNESNGG